MHTVTNGSIKDTIEHKKKFTFVEDKVFPKKLINDIRGNLIPVNYRKDLISKDHFAMVKQGLTEPFKINSLDFESYKTNLRSRLHSKHLTASSTAKFKLSEMRTKNEIIDKYI